MARCPSAAAVIPSDAHVQVSDDALADKMSARKRAMALGRFKVIEPSTGHMLEERPEFKAIVERAPRRPRYWPNPLPGVEPLEQRRRPDKTRTRYSHPGDYPQSGERFHVAWLSGEGDIQVDRFVRLYDAASVQSYEVDDLSEGPLSRCFGLVDLRLDPMKDQCVNFDANLFWTVALLFKHFRTCGIELWDWELDGMLRQAGGVAPLTGVMPHPPALHSLPSSPPPLAPFVPPPHFHTLHPSTPLRHGVDSANEVVVGRRYTGCIRSWRGHYGFLSCTLIPCNVFLHVSNVVDGRESFENEGDLVGISVNFELAKDSEKGFQALRAKAYI